VNIAYYFHFGLWILSLDMFRCKFLDECHLVSKDLYRNLGLGPIGEPVIMLRGGNLSERYTVTLLTDIAEASSKPPVYVTLTKESHDQYNFLEAIVGALETGHLVRGDILFTDNAKAHVAHNTFELIFDLLSKAGVRWIYLPKFSPEYNPCELVFAQLKKKLRDYRGDENFLWELSLALASIKRKTVINYYRHCFNLL